MSALIVTIGIVIVRTKLKCPKPRESTRDVHTSIKALMVRWLQNIYIILLHKYISKKKNDSSLFVRLITILDTSNSNMFPA